MRKYSFVIILGDKKSERSHNFNTKECKSGTKTTKVKTQYLGNKINDERPEFIYRQFEKGCIIKFSLKMIREKCNGAILRRTYIAELGDWNFSARIKVNGENQGIWFVPKGATDNKVNAGQDNFLISESTLVGHDTVDVDIEPLSHWHDVEYSIYYIIQ